MAGGIGSRFWPLSTEEKPKQFVDIFGSGKSFIRQTYERFLPLIKRENIFVITNARYNDLVKQEIPELSDNQIMLEPVRRNTAPCIAYATHKIKSLNRDAVIIMTPSDHFITNEAAFCADIKESVEFAKVNNALMTIGITPTHPETGYGYIQCSEVVEGRIEKVKTFTEKPNLEMAQVFIDSGEFIWNSGIFIWKASSILYSMERLMPENNELFVSGESYYNTPSEQQFIDETYPKCVNISIDYGIMERSDNVFVCRSDFGWSDIGTWASLYDFSEKDGSGNSGVNENIEILDSSNCIISISKGKKAVIQGLDGYIIAEDNDSLLICKREDHVKLIANKK